MLTVSTLSGFERYRKIAHTTFALPRSATSTSELSADLLTRCSGSSTKLSSVSTSIELKAIRLCVHTGEKIVTQREHSTSLSAVCS